MPGNERGPFMSPQVVHSCRFMNQDTLEAPTVEDKPHNVAPCSMLHVTFVVRLELQMAALLGEDKPTGGVVGGVLKL